MSELIQDKGGKGTAVEYFAALVRRTSSSLVPHCLSFLYNMSGLGAHDFNLFFKGIMEHCSVQEISV